MMRHLAVIMDGNGRWAKAHHKPRLAGHKAGADALDRVMHYCKDVGIEYLTVYAFSTENWKRSEEEVSGLMKLLSAFIKSKEKTLVKEGVRFRVIGRRTDLSARLQKEIAALEEKTKGGGFTLVVALSYGGRDEIVRAVERYVRRGKDTAAPVEGTAALTGDAESFPLRESSTLTGDAESFPLREEEFAKYLDTADIPDPDLIIRTSGELRLSNFLLWQAAYAEFYFTDVLWPDFDRAEFDRAIESFSHRERRLGGRVS